MKNKPVVVVRTTPEMANWMHPQNEERKQRIRERAAEAKARYLQRLDAENKASTSAILTPRIDIQNGIAQIVPLRKLKPGKKVRVYRLRAKRR